MKFTKILALALVALMMLSIFAACDNGKQNEQTTDAGTQAPTEGTTEEVTTEPETTEPETTEPETTEPETTVPGDETTAPEEDTTEPEPETSTEENTTEPEDEIKLITEAMGQRGTVDCTAGLGGTFHNFGRLLPDRAVKIDYIFTDACCTQSYVVEDIPVEGQYYSDHNAVCAMIEFA